MDTSTAMHEKVLCDPGGQEQSKEGSGVDDRIAIFHLLALLQNRPLFQVIYPGYIWARDKRWLLSRVQRLAGPAGGHEPFVPGGATNPDKRPPFCPGWWLHPGQKGPTLLSRVVIPVGVTNPDKRPIHVIVQKGVILY